MMKGTYDFLAQDRVVFGESAHVGVLSLADHYDAKRVFVVAGKTLNRKTDAIQKISESLGSRYIGTFDNCVEHTPRSTVIELAQVLGDAKPDLVVTVGGGTPIDTVKLALLCLAHGVRDVETFGTYRIQVDASGSRNVPKVNDPPVRQIVVPTTLSAAEFTCLGGSTDPERQVKDLYMGHKIGAMAVVLDPEITVHTPQWLWLSTGIRAVDHAVETICSNGHQPFTDATCIRGLKLLRDGLMAVHEDSRNMPARLSCQLGVWLSSTGVMRVDMGASHGIGHQLGAVAGVAHGFTSCILLPAVLEYNRSVNAHRQQIVSEALGEPNKLASELVRELVKSLGLPGSLRDVGVKRESFEPIAEGALKNIFVRSNPRKISQKNEVYEILERCW